MKRFSRSRKGFTLAEIILVVAIIVILAAASIVGVATILNNAKKNQAQVELHAGGWYVYASADEPGAIQKDVDGNGTLDWVKVVPKGTPDAQYYSDWDEMYAQVNAINVVTPMPQGSGDHPGGDPIGPGTGGSGTGGSGSAGQHTQSASDMLKEFLEHYGISYTENGGNITWNHDGDYGGQSFADAWNQWKKDHTNSTGGGSSSGGNNVSTGGSGSGSSGSGSSGSTGGSGSTGSGSESGSGATTGTTVGSVNLPGGVVTGQHDKGVYSIKSTGSNTVTVSLQTNAWYQQDITITKSGNNYTLSVSGDNRYILNNGASNNLWPELDKNNKTYTLNDAQKEYLKDYWGINLI